MYTFMGIYVKSASPTYNHQEVSFPATTSKIKQMFKITGKEKKKKKNREGNFFFARTDTVS